MSKINVTKISDSIWQFNESNENGPYVDAYLICGDNKALLVDSLQNEPDLLQRVREITDLPLEVVITHGHGDHAGESLEAFAKDGYKIYMDLYDYDNLVSFGPKNVKKDWFTDCYDGIIFDLGKYVFKIVSVPGHTKGSLVLIDEKNKLMFSGDTIGSGSFWMQIPTAMPLNFFNMSLEKLYNITKNIKGLLIYPGHRNQSEVQLDESYVKDVRTITKGLINGTMKGEPTVLDFKDRHMEYEQIGYGMMNSYCYNPNAIHGDDPQTEIQKLRDKFEEKKMYQGSNYLNYMEFTPKLKDAEKYPLVLYLHGGGERGEGNTRLVLANSGATTFASESWQNENPCYIIAPQCPMDTNWNNEKLLKLIVSKIMEMTRTAQVDVSRVYVTGLSMGGMGTWKVISMFPNIFAGAMPICGAGNPFEVKKAKNVPVWAFHAEDDEVVPVTGKFKGHGTEEIFYGTRQMVSSLRGAGAREVKYTEYPNGYMNKVVHAFAHGSWIPAYEDKTAKEWLFSQNRFTRYDVELVVPGVWYIEDFNNDSMYLVEGTEKALLIDTGLGGGDIVGLVKSLTKLPIELAITHAHGDHMYHCDKFGKFYMSKKEEAVLPRFLSMMMPHLDPKDIDYTDIKSGYVINLGGGVEIEVWEVAGHTPGSVVFIDKYHKACFTGDALGVWMQVPGALSISEYKEDLVKFNEKLADPELSEIFFLGGHKRQEGGVFPFGEDYKPNSPERVKDMIILCDKILADEVDVSGYPFSFDEPALAADYGSASMVFKKSIKK